MNTQAYPQCPQGHGLWLGAFGLYICYECGKLYRVKPGHKKLTVGDVMWIPAPDDLEETDAPMLTPEQMYGEDMEGDMPLLSLTELDDLFEQTFGSRYHREEFTEEVAAIEAGVDLNDGQPLTTAEEARIDELLAAYEDDDPQPPTAHERKMQDLIDKYEADED